MQTFPIHSPTTFAQDKRPLFMRKFADDDNKEPPELPEIGPGPYHEPRRKRTSALKVSRSARRPVHMKDAAEPTHVSPAASGHFGKFALWQTL